MKTFIFLLTSLLSFVQARSVGKGVEVANGYNVEMKYETTNKRIRMTVIQPDNTYFLVSFVQNFTN
jgi:hypothetical protein